MNATGQDTLKTRRTLTVQGKSYDYFSLPEAAKSLGVFHLTGCELYTTCEPCPMCLAAIYWARVDRYYFGCTAQDAAAIEFADAFIHHELGVPPEKRTIPATGLMRSETLTVFEAWKAKTDRVAY